MIGTGTTFILFLVMLTLQLKTNGEERVLFKTRFLNPLPKTTLVSNLKHETRPMHRKTDGMALYFLRDDSLNKGSSARLNVPLNTNTNLLRFTSLILIGDHQPNGRRQVSSRSFFRIFNADVTKYLEIGFTTKRYNRNRSVVFRDFAGTAKTTPVVFPVNKFMKLVMMVDMKRRLWRCVVRNSDGLKIFDTDTLKLKSPFSIDEFRFVCETGSRNDGLEIAIAKLKISSASSAEWKRFVREADKDSCATRPRSYEKVNSGLYNSNFFRWSGDNLIDRVALSSPASAERQAANLADLGISSVLFNGRHFRSAYTEEFEEIEKCAAVAADACRAHGIEMVEHHDPTIIGYRAYPFLLSRLEWTQRDLRTGETSFWFCPLRREFQNYFLSYIAKYQKRLKLAGYMIDELSFNNTHFCGCDTCRKKFKSDTGLDAPDMLKPGLRSLTEIKFRKWQKEQLLALKHRLLGVIREYRGDSFIMTYCSDYTDPHSSLHDLAESAATFSPFVGWENMIYNPLNSYRSMIRALKNRNSYGDFYNIPIWSLNREEVEARSHYLAWAMCQGTRHSIWYGSRVPIEKPDDRAFFKRYNTWKKRMPHQFARYLANVAVLFSQQTKALTKSREFAWNDFSGFMDMLIVNNRQYDVILDGNLYYPGYLGKYDVVAIPSQAALSNTQCRNLERWVRNGGTAVVTGMTSLYDENGCRRPDFKLGRAMNLTYAGALGGKHIISSDIFGNNMKLDEIFLVKLLDPSKSKVLAVAESKKNGKTPFVVETKYGKGRFIYVAGKPGAPVCELEARNGRRYSTRDIPEIEKFIVALYDYAENGKPHVKVEAPRNVVVLADQIIDGAENGDIYAHLYNFTGKNVKFGDVAHYGRKENMKFPPLNSDVKIAIQAPCGSNALLQSPELDDDVEITGERQNDGSTLFVVPKEKLKMYAHLKIPSNGRYSASKRMKILEPPLRVASDDEKYISKITPKYPDTTNLYKSETARVAFRETPGKKDFPLTLKGAVVVRSDGWDLTRSEIKGVIQEASLTPIKEKWYENGSISIGEAFKEKMPWTREIYENDKLWEITVAANIPPEDNGAYSCAYCVKIPVETLKGMEVAYYSGMHRSDKRLRKYVFTGEEPEGKYIVLSMRHGVFTGGKTDFTIDFCPDGIWGLFNEEQTTTAKAHLLRKGGDYVFRVATNRVRYGRKITNKIIIYKGVRDLLKLHPMQRVHYAWNRPADFRVQFGVGKPLSGFKVGKNIPGYDRDFTMSQLQPYSKNLGYGWCSAKGAKLISLKAQGELPIFDQGVAGVGNATFRFDQSNGIGVLNVILSGRNGAVKGVVEVNGVERAFDIPKNGRETVAVPVKTTNGFVEFTVKGSFMVSGVVHQPLASSAEDFIFSRSYWRTGAPPWKSLNDDPKHWLHWIDLPYKQAKFPPPEL